uniref:Uncharacterized protein n=1 Tax=Steinernema glaseri TaxID=37863 RepID=A0A1I7YRE9_9BILA
MSSTFCTCKLQSLPRNCRERNSESSVTVTSSDLRYSLVDLLLSSFLLSLLPTGNLKEDRADRRTVRSQISPPVDSLGHCPPAVTRVGLSTSHFAAAGYLRFRWHFSCLNAHDRPASSSRGP